MKIETKFNVGDIIFTLLDNKVNEIKVNSIEIYFYKNSSFSIIYLYYIKEMAFKINENSCFGTKQELLNSL